MADTQTPPLVSRQHWAASSDGGHADKVQMCARWQLALYVPETGTDSIQLWQAEVDHRTLQLLVVGSRSLANRCSPCEEGLWHTLWNENPVQQCRDLMAVVGTHSCVEAGKVVVRSSRVLTVKEAHADEATCHTLSMAVNDEAAGEEVRR